MSMGKEMPSCPPAALRCFLPAAFRGNLDKNRIVPVSEIPAEYGAYRTTETTTVTSNKSTNLPSKIAWTPQKVPKRSEKHDVDSRAIRCTPDWSENAVAGDHLWVPTSVSGDCCYVGDNECVKHGPRMKCSACKIIAHANCIGILMERNKLSCKPTFRDVGIRQYREQTTTHHHWVHRRTEKGKCKQCGKSLQAKLSFGSKEIVALSCAWCKSSFHNKESCFNQHRIGEECSLGIHSSIIVPPSWIVKLPRKGSFKSSLRKSPRKKQVGKKKPKDREPRTFVIKPIPTANVTPVIVFINPKSGGNQGAKLLQKFQWLLNPRQVFDLTQGGPKMGLELFRKVPQLRILACGGDGTVGWVLSVLDQIGFTPPPAVGVLPLGTGNDLARSLGWGGGYTDEPIGKILANIGDSDTVLLDRWSLRVEPNPSAKSDSLDGKDELPLNVVNNYFSLGVDAHIALEFHEAREAHPEKFNSRLRNKMFYGQAGGKDLLKRKWKGLADFVTLECDGKDLTPKLRELKVHAIVFLNIPSYGGGTHPWNKSGGQYEPSTDDALIEVVGLTTYQLPLLQAGGHGSCITQCRSAKIVTSKTIPMQVDGEACKLKPSIIEINLLNKAVMLAKRKPGRINVQHSTLEPLNISINRITMSDYEKHHYDKDLLKQSATSIGCIEVNPIADLENVRTLVNRQCETAVESGVKLSSEWCFVDSCTAERFFRVDRAQEHLHYITDIANDALYILDQDCPTMPQTPEDETALASPSSLHQPPNTSPSESSEKDSRECTPLTPQKKFFNRSLSGPGPTTNLDNLSPTLNRMTYQSDSDNEVIRNGKTLETKTINFRSNLLEKTTDVVIKAAKSGDLLLLKELHTQGYSLLSIDSTGQTALHYGAQYGHKDIVRFLISYAPNSIINMLDNERGQTALHMAAANKRRSICYMLVAAGANLDIQDNEGRTPKMLAILADDHNLATYLEMLDATGKISSGLLQGNINQLGNYDLCTDIATRVKVTEKDSVRIQGKYCLASIELQAEDENLKLPLHLIQGKSLLRSSLADPNHFLPRFTIFNWGICVPAACSAADIEDFLDDTLEDYNATGVTVFVDLKDEDCYVKKKQDWNNLLKTEWQLTATIAGVCFVLVIATLATMNDWWIQWKRAAIVIEIVDGNDEDGKRGESVAIPPEEGNTEPLEMVNQVLMAFSMRQTLRDLVHLRDGEIGCIHGLKTIASLSIFLTLKTLQVVRLPWSNRIALTETLDNPATLPLRSPLLSMDLFLVLSGILVAYGMCTDFETYGRIRWIRRILGRVLRLLPLLALSTLFTAWIWPHLGSGPLWGDIIEENSDICQESFWKNFLFINNWGDIEESCSPHTTQLAIEFQLFLLSPLVIWLMYRSPVMGLGLFGLLHAFSAATRFSDTQQNRLSPWIFHGMKLSQIHRTINLSFGSLLHRITPYMGGLGLGMMLHQTGRNVRLSDGIKYGGWASCLISFTWCFASQWDITRRDYVYDPTEMAKSTAWTPLIWTIAISWIVFACNSGNGGILSDILSSKPMIFMSRISYAMYFVEFIVLNTTAATVQHPDAFGLSDFLDWVEIGAIIACATALSLIFDLPMYSVKALLLNAAEAEDAQPATDSPAEAEQSDRATGEPEEEIEDIFGEQDEVKEKLPKRKIQFYAEENEDDEPEGHVGGGEATDDIWGIDERNEEFIPKRPSSYAKRYNYSKTPDEDNLGANEEDEAVDEEEEEENGEEIEEKEIARRSRRW